MPSSETPSLRLRKGHAKPLHAGHPWVFANAIAGCDAGSLQAGDEVRVLDARGHVLGRGYYSPASALAVRLLTRNDEPAGASLLSARIQSALSLRRDVLGLGRETGQTLVSSGDAAAHRLTSAYRLVHSEGDGLPGLVVDSYGEYLCVQFGTAGMFRRREAILEILQAALSPRAIVDKSNAGMLRLEKVELPENRVLAGSEPPAPIAVMENGRPFLVDLMRGQKTGLFLDQRENRLRFASFAAGRDVLDVFSYTGGFAIQASHAGAKTITLIDSSEPALMIAKENLTQNGIKDADLVCSPWTDALRMLKEQGSRFDLVVLDPPKFAQKMDHVPNALMTYRDLNAHAARLIVPGGLLFTCSCSGNVTEQDFERAVASGLSQSGRRATIIERRGPSPDHPTPPGFEKGSYLKCLILRLE